jgi:hypothetical protein
MSKYYAYWESKIYHALVHAIATAITTFHMVLEGNYTMRDLATGKRSSPPLPLVRITATMNPTQIMLSPNNAQVYDAMKTLSKAITEAAKSFIRWWDGTCNEVPPLSIPNKDKKTRTTHLISFHHFIYFHPLITSLLENLWHWVQGQTEQLKTYTSRWTKYQLPPHSLWAKRIPPLDVRFCGPAHMHSPCPCPVWY